MKCPKCGTELRKGDEFCSECGLQVKKEERTERRESKNQKKTPKWYLTTSLVMIVLFVLLTFACFETDSPELWLSPPFLLLVLVGSVWFIFNISLMAYFLIENFRKTSIALPTGFILLIIILPVSLVIEEMRSIISVVSSTVGGPVYGAASFLPNINKSTIFIELGLFILFAIGYYLYELRS